VKSTKGQNSLVYVTYIFEKDYTKNEKRRIGHFIKYNIYKYRRRSCTNNYEVALHKKITHNHSQKSTENSTNKLLKAN